MFCVIARRDDRFFLVNHAPVPYQEAAVIAREHTGARITKFSVAANTLRFLNNEHSTVDEENLRTELEESISAHIRKYVSLTRKKVTGIFVGHERYEVEVTIEDN